MTFRLLVGLGNPGAQYERTRHNIGFLAMEEFARSQGWEWKEEKRFSGRLAGGQFEGEKIYLLEPLTFMNESGRSVRKVLDYYKLAPSDVLIVVDDVAIPFQEMRLKEGGSPGGHNGLKSIEQHLGTRTYARLRMGVGDRKQGTLHGHVLGRFSQAEEEQLAAFVAEANKTIERLLKGETFERVAMSANRRKEQGLLKSNEPCSHKKKKPKSAEESGPGDNT